MRKDKSGRPLCGTGPKMLGARVPTDIAPDDQGTVSPETGGLSVTPDDPAFLPVHLRPKALGGQGKLPVFKIPVAALGALLAYRPDPKGPDRHGFIEPLRVMLLDAYQAALAATAPSWEAT
jgi:hypothetical protein